MSTIQTSQQGNQESVQNLGPLPPFSQWQIKSHYFPDVVPHEERGVPVHGGTQPELLLKHAPETLVKQKEDVSLYVVKAAPSPLVLWLHDQLIVGEPTTSLSVKHDGSVSCLNVKCGGLAEWGTYTCQIINAAGDCACSTPLRLKTGWQLHALVLTSRFLNVDTH